MVRTIATGFGGAILGAVAMAAFMHFERTEIQSGNEIVRDLTDVQKMAPMVAEKHRDEHYANLHTVAKIVALPTEFARSEAMYALAGRSDSASIQKLIFEADRFSDDVERIRLLSVLFFRLAETDPNSALALARIDRFQGIKSIGQLVWYAWAGIDFEEALFAAKTQTSRTRQNEAAQSLYAAFGFMGNETTERIETELGIAPDRATRSAYLYQLADRSPAEAIAFINGLERGTEQIQYVSWLAQYVSLRDPVASLQFADLFLATADSKTYRNVINGNITRENPQAAIERLLADGENLSTSREYHNALRALAGTDIDATKQYFSQARSSEHRQIIGSMIASELAKSDPAEAMAWARANDDRLNPHLQMLVLREITRTNPQLALAEALEFSNVQLRSSMISMVVQSIAGNDPAVAVVYLDQIQDREQRRDASQQLAFTWMRRDPEAAIAWIQSQDKDVAAQIMQMAGFSLLSSDLDSAIRLLPRFNTENQYRMRQQIAKKLATDRSPADAQSFIAQFEGKPGYLQLQSSIIVGVAETDALIAKQMADQLTDSQARDSAYVQVIAQRAQVNPADAISWLENIRDSQVRGVAAGRVAAQWFARDSVAAMQWVSKLPAGPSKDDAIMHMSSQWGDLDSEKERLIASIEDRDKRGQAKVRQIYILMRQDPVKARQLLEDEDIPSYQRQQVETMISRYGLGF